MKRETENCCILIYICIAKYFNSYEVVNFEVTFAQNAMIPLCVA